MLFIIDRPRLQRMIAITRDDRRKNRQGPSGPFFRIEASGEQVKLSGHQTEATLPATVLEEGVLFLRITIFRRLLATFTGEKMITIQCNHEGLIFGDVRMRFERSDMLLYLDPARAPEVHPGERRRDEQGTLF